MIDQLQHYKKGQGMIARWTAGSFVLLMAWFGCYSLYEHPSHEGWWGHALVGIESLDLALNWGLIISSLLGLGFAALTWRFVVNQPRAADFLIETEAELRKVSWPAKHEYLNASFVVIVSVVLLSTWLVVCDVALTWLLRIFGY